MVSSPKRDWDEKEIMKIEKKNAGQLPEKKCENDWEILYELPPNTQGPLLIASGL